MLAVQELSGFRSLCSTQCRGGCSFCKGMALIFSPWVNTLSGSWNRINTRAEERVKNIEVLKLTFRHPRFPQERRQKKRPKWDALICFRQEETCNTVQGQLGRCVGQQGSKFQWCYREIHRGGHQLVDNDSSFLWLI